MVIIGYGKTRENRTVIRGIESLSIVSRYGYLHLFTIL